VLGDVLDGFVSAEAARVDYAVALTPDGRTVDVDATAALRASRTRPVKMYHRGRYFDADERL
jgi:N-methylhydantoinase B